MKIVAARKACIRHTSYVGKETVVALKTMNICNALRGVGQVMIGVGHRIRVGAFVAKRKPVVITSIILGVQGQTVDIKRFNTCWIGFLGILSGRNCEPWRVNGVVVIPPTVDYEAGRF
jgi:hypothetical protein